MKESNIHIPNGETNVHRVTPNTGTEVLHVVSNRKIEANPTGGMAEAMNQALSASNGDSNGNGHKIEIPEIKIWTAWDGKKRTEPATQAFEKEIVTTATGTSYEVIGIPLEADEYDDYYLGYSNEVLWPLNHGYPEYSQYDNEKYWEAYKKVNRKDAGIIADSLLQMTDENPLYQPLIWYQDYHKVLGAKYLREELRTRGMPDEQMPPMALFMHTPIASRDDFSLLPDHQQDELLDGYLNYDLLGFHTTDYVKNFRRYVQKFSPDAVLLDTPDGLSITHNGRRTLVGTFPIGIDPKFLHTQADTQEVQEDAVAVRAGLGKRKMIFNAARRDYMKGFPEGLDAINTLYTRHPQVLGNVVYVQGDQPSRSEIDKYAEIDGQIQERVDRISDRFKRADWLPIDRYVEGFKRPLMLSRLQETDILFISSTRDGFCLVPLEFLELNERNGVAVVSDRVGAATVYDEAMLTVNIYNERETAEALYYAYNMPEQERKDMIERGRSLIRENDIHTWANKQLQQMRRIRTGLRGA